MLLWFLIEVEVCESEIRLMFVLNDMLLENVKNIIIFLIDDIQIIVQDLVVFSDLAVKSTNVEQLHESENVKLLLRNIKNG